MNKKIQALINLAKQAAQGNQDSQKQLMQIASQVGPDQMMQIAQQVAGIDQQAGEILASVAQSMAQSAKFGAKLNYLKFLDGKCPEGYEMQYFKNGGKAGCKKCQKAQEGEKVQDLIEEFKCGRKMKKKACGGSKMKKFENPDGPIKKAKLTETDEGYEGDLKDGTYVHFTPKTTYIRTSKGKWIDSNKNKSEVDSVLNVNKKEVKNPYVKKNANGGILTMDDIRARLGGGQFIPFLKKGLN